MKYRLFIQIFSAIALSLSATLTLDRFSYAQERTYTCGTTTDRTGKQVPATLISTPKGNIPIILWVVDLPPLTPQERCQEVSARFQRFADNRLLQYLRTGIFDGQPVLCVATKKGGTCSRENVLITLPRRTNAGETLTRLLDLRRHAAKRPLKLSGSEVFYAVLELYVDVEAFANFLTETEGSTERKN